MLVLGVKKGDSVTLRLADGQEIHVYMLRDGLGLRWGFEAPKEVTITRDTASARRAQPRVK